MSRWADFEERARRTGLSVERLVRQHLLHGVLRRWAASAQHDAFVLRGGLLTQLWLGSQRRATRDLDLLGLYPRRLDETTARLRAILQTPADDGVAFDLDTWRCEVIWKETAFPGHRCTLDTRVGEHVLPLQIDVGFGDPLVPPAQGIDYPLWDGTTARVQAAAPELLVAWKLHGLFEHGAKRWQAKDLFDLYLLTQHLLLNEEVLAEAITTAFAAHADPLPEVLNVVYQRTWWETETAQKRWAKFRVSAEMPVPDDLLQVARAVACRLRPSLTKRLAFPTTEGWPES